MHVFATGANPLRMDFEIHRIGNPNVVVTRTAQSLVYEVDGYRYAFTGTGLTYDAQGRPTGGWLNSFQYSKDGAILFDKAATQSWGLDPVVLAIPDRIGDQNLARSLLSGNDHAHGSDLDDWIVDISGHNYFYGGGGNDTMVAGDGNDHLYGHSASGGPDGADYIESGGGGDYVQGNAGNDTILGGDGSDRINGGADDDHLSGDAGNDTINGNRGNDGISGGAGNDLLRGGQGNDSIAGDDGDDVIMGDLGVDLLRGGAGADIFVFGAGTSPIGESVDQILDFEDGIDHISLGFTPLAVLSGTALSTGSSFMDGARAAAQALFDQHAGSGEIAVIGGGASPLIFWSGNGGDQVDSVVQMSFTPNNYYGLDDFI
nr:calcium-binding protein [Sphingomonas sp. Y57]